MAVARHRLYELDGTDQVMNVYTVMCRSDAAALAMARACAHVGAVEVWEGVRHVARLAQQTPRDRLRHQWMGEPLGTKPTAP
jgi:hypothetical protein